MKSFDSRVLFLLALISLFFVTAAVAVSASDFVGFWRATDGEDGSNLTMLIRGRRGDRLRILLFDDGATICGVDNEGNPLYPAIYRGRGEAVGDVLDARGRTLCLSRPADLLPAFDATLTYNSGPGTIDAFNSTFSRLP